MIDAVFSLLLFAFFSSSELPGSCLKRKTSVQTNYSVFFFFPLTSRVWFNSKEDQGH